MVLDATRRGHRMAFGEKELFHLRTLARQVPTEEAAVARIAALRAKMALPKGTVHVFSDVHGEHEKLRHVINNASGRLRPVVERLFAGRLDDEGRRRLLNVIYYPWEQLGAMSEALSAPEALSAFVKETVGFQVELLRALSGGYPLDEVTARFPEAYRGLLLELLVAPALGRPAAWGDALVDTLVEHGKGLEFVRRLSRAIRNLAFDEIIVAGDLGDRGPRIDKVIAYLMRQPEVSVIWGNHDVLWMGACLGQRALIATTIRVSLRYARLAQLVEGYGVGLEPLRALAQARYGDDPCARFGAKVKDLSDPALTARMQKAIAVIQFKLEGQLTARHPEWGMEDRNLLHRIDLEAGTVEIDGQAVALADARLPTLDPADPYALSDDEETCIAALERSFLHSPVLWQHMSWLFRRGSMYLMRDDFLLFHGAVPVTEEGQPRGLEIDGLETKGKGLFDACQALVHRAFRQQDPDAVDFLWYLWAGPVSPLFGKDKMATFESYFIADKAFAKETKDPYFKLIHDAEFVRGVCRGFGVDPEAGVVVNGHVPVKIEAGESPVKRGGNAVTIDGAFAAAYGDKGYTMILGAEQACLAQHHSFDSVEASIERGADIVPEVQVLRAHDPPRRVADTEAGQAMAREIASLERLIVAYQENLIREHVG